MTDIIRRADEFLPDWDNAALPTVTQRNQADRMRDWVELFKEVYKAAEVLSKTNFVPKEMVGNTANVAAAVMKGFELGIDPLDALASMYVIHGRVGMYAEFQRRRIIQAGHTFRIVETTDTRCIVEGVRRDTGETHRATFTSEAARKAGIDLGKYPAEKLIARATSRLCKQAFPDVLSGTLIAEDLIDGLIPTDDDVTDHITAEGPAGPPVQRKRATKPAKAARTQPKAAATPHQPDTDIAELLGDQPVGSLKPDEPQQAQPGHALKTATRAERRHNEPTPHTTGPEPEQQLPVQTDPVANDELPLDEPPRAMTKKQSDTIFALNNELGVGPRTDRLTLLSHILRRQILTSKELTIDDASTVIDTIKDWQTNIDWDVQDRIREILNQAAINQAEQENAE